MSDRNKPYALSSEALDALVEGISPARFSTYLGACHGDGERAIRLYMWNASISAAFYFPLQTLEISLRNALHGRLREKFGAEWYDNPAAGLHERHRERVGQARRSLQQKRHAVTPERMVSELSFGFWVFLLSRSYNDALWRPTLRRAFPHIETITRPQAHLPLLRLKDLRNRIAHHEPIFSQSRHRLHERHRDALRIIGWMSPVQRDWVAAHSRVEEVLNMPRDSATPRL